MPGRRIRGYPARGRAITKRAPRPSRLSTMMIPPGAPASAAARFIDLVEAVEDVRQFGLGDSRAGIRDAEEPVTTAFGGTDDDLAAPRRVLQGIVQQGGQYLNCPVGVGLDRRQARGKVNGEGHARVVGPRPERLPGTQDKD